MTTRVLGIGEYDKLKGLSPDFNFNHLSPLRTKVIVVEEDDEIIGVLGIQTILCFEPSWVKPGWRGRWVFNRLADKLKELYPNPVGAMAHTEQFSHVKQLKRLGFTHHEDMHCLRVEEGWRSK